MIPSDSDKQTSLLIDIYLNFFFLTLLSDFSRRQMFVHKKVDGYICTVIHALTALLWYASLNFVWFADIVALVCIVYCLDIDTSSSTGKFRKAVSTYFSNMFLRNVVARNAAYF